MIEINGENGGGQVLRTALTLSAVENKAFRMENIRGSRSNPGLKNQHLECVKAVQRLSNAEVEGAELGSDSLVFKPQELRNESFTSNIGTAGSITLLFDTVIPIGTRFSGSFRLTGKGGTDVKWSPPIDYLKQIKLPLLEKFGLKASVDLEKTGYYPSGNGEANLTVESSEFEPIELKERGELERFEVYSKASKDLESQNVADRQADEAERILKNSHMSKPVEKNVSYRKTSSTGSTLVVKAVYENSVAGFDVLGEKGKRSEEVANEAVRGFKKFHSSDAAVDEHMADQLMLYLGLFGGEIKVRSMTSHLKSSIDILEEFDRSFQVEKGENLLIAVEGKRI
ncbi:MAG: RNA 3'-terminal phosphate cyclase [Nanohaloarchaea archaeon]|nr:RNA 3'-terminal phosphate cyclase [Candidatus Nanohaloarchaea archaeon]